MGIKYVFAQAFLEDMSRKQCDAMIIYGGYHSNLCRILAAACAGERNSVQHDPQCGRCRSGKGKQQRAADTASGVREYRCHKADIAAVVQRAMEDFEKAGRRPYYIYGNIYGEGNAAVPMKAYAAVYREILDQEREMGVHFDYIFLASSTNTTQSGLLAGHLEAGDERENRRHFRDEKGEACR